MREIYLFDWGNTLMVDFPGSTGKMRYWNRVEAVEYAEDVLSKLAMNGEVYIATSAADSAEEDIRAAFEMVGLETYISGYFCMANLGISKGTSKFFQAILNRLECSPDEVVMVGDSMEKDILPAVEAGIHAVYFNPDAQKKGRSGNFREIKSLCELI